MMTASTSLLQPFIMARRMLMMSSLPQSGVFIAAMTLMMTMTLATRSG